MKYLWLGAMDQMEKWVVEMEKLTGINDMKDFNLKKKLTSSFRRLIGNGQANHITFTANHRALRHIIHMRTDASAEEEIRIVFGKIYEIVRAKFPSLYSDAEVTWVDDLPQVKFKSEKV
jgi:thymidylate synthase (FAD)